MVTQEKRTPPVQGQGQSSTKVTCCRGEVIFCRGMNQCSGADAICRRSSVSPGAVTFKFHNTTTLELLSHVSTNTVHKSEPREASPALHPRPSLSKSTAGYHKFGACSTAVEQWKPGIMEGRHSWGAVQMLEQSGKWNRPGKRRKEKKKGCQICRTYLAIPQSLTILVLSIFN